MKKYLITYDLNRNDKNYEGVINKIKTFGDWAHPMGSVWFVYTNMTAGNIRDELNKLVDNNDDLFVCKIGEYASFLQQDFNDWLTEHPNN